MEIPDQSLRCVRDHFARIVTPTLMLAAFFLVGCWPAHVKILHLHSDSALKVKQLEQDRVAILPAMSSTPMMDVKELTPVRAQLASQITASRPTIALVEQARVDRALRERPLGPILQRFARTLAISREDLHELSAATGAKFIVFTVFDEYSFGWGERAAPEYRANADPRGIGSAVGGLVGVGLTLVIRSAMGPVQPGEGQSATLRGHAEARLSGTLSIFNAIEGRAVWVGAAMVNESVNEATEVPAIGARQSSAPIPEPPEPAQLTPSFLEALVDRWPS